MRSNLVEMEFSQALWRRGAGVAAYAVGLLQGLVVAFIWEGQSFIFLVLLRGIYF